MGKGGGGQGAELLAPDGREQATVLLKESCPGSAGWGGGAEGGHRAHWRPWQALESVGNRALPDYPGESYSLLLVQLTNLALPSTYSYSR